MHDIFLVLKGLYMLLTNIDDFLSKELLPGGYPLNYSLSRYPEEDEDNEDEEENEPLLNTFVWYGTPAELACLMGTLNEKGITCLSVVLDLS